MARDLSLLEALGARILYLLESGVREIPLRSPARDLGGAPESRTLSAGGVEPVSAEGLLEEIRRELETCNRCPLGRTRRNLVFGEGNPHADILFVGEGPGSEEDATGRPFVGPAGQLLTKIIEAGMGVPRSSVYICNIVKCRPPNNRPPLDEEAEACMPFLERQIEAIRPRVIITLGHTAASRLLGLRGPMHQLRGKWQTFRGIPVMPTFHPSYVLRYYTVAVRRQVWEDVQEAMRLLKGSGPPSGREEG